MNDENEAAQLTAARSMVVISDRVDNTGESGEGHAAGTTSMTTDPWHVRQSGPVEVCGGYLERLPLACIAAGLIDQAEIWHHQLGGHRAPIGSAGPYLGYRGLQLDSSQAPFENAEMLAFVRRFGAPHVLVVYGLGVSLPLLRACARSIIVYNSIDAPTLRVPPEISACFDLVLTGAPWQSQEVVARHPGMATAVMPVGPEFAAINQFRPLGTPKDYDLIYVAAAQPYKQHDILFDAFAVLPPGVRGLCVFGYGEDAGLLRHRIAARGLSIDCIGPPGVTFEEVNRLMNLARFGVVCGRDDGAPAILTEYLLAGLPVLANSELACGQQYILPETGRLAAPDAFADGIMGMRDDFASFQPREAALARWTWPHTIRRLAPILGELRRTKHVRQ